MVLKGDLDALVNYAPVPGSPVLSVYLDIDQSVAANWNRGFEIALKNALRTAARHAENDKAALEAFEKDAEQVNDFVMAYTPAGKGLVIMCDESEKFFWRRNLQVRVATEARWEQKPYIRPLVEARDEYERYGIILTDKRQARLFIVFLGEIEERREALARFRVRHFKAAGLDHLWSQMIFQRKSTEHAKWHLKKVAQMMAKLEEEQEFDRLILAGPTDALNMLEDLLTEALRTRLIGKTPMEMEASEKEILDVTARLEEAFERKMENELVGLLLTASAKERRAVTGLDKTVSAAAEGRIMSLVYKEGREAAGGECHGCGALFEEQPEQCPHCGGHVDPLDDLMERLIETAVKTGDSVELVRGEAAETLDKEGGGIGAFLRF